MKREDLLNNDLLDDGLKVGKKVLGGYEKAQKWMLYIAIAKYAAVGIVVIGLLWGGYAFVSGVSGMVSDAVVVEVKEAAKEKGIELTDAAKEKLADVKTKAKEKTKGHSLADLGGAFAKLKMGVEEKYNEAVDGALVEQGYHPDAPAYCIGNKDEHNEACAAYTDAEVDGTVYRSIAMWDSACPITHLEAMKRLKVNGKITKNDNRELDPVCIRELNRTSDDEREQMKADMLKEAGVQ